MTTTDTATDLASIAPISHREAGVLAREAYRRLADAVEALGPDDWEQPTDCAGWTVRDLVGHLVGAMRSAASIREVAQQQLEVARRQKMHGGSITDVMTALQIERTAELTTEELTTELRSLVHRAARGRRRTPAPMRRWVHFEVPLREGTERWSLGYLNDVILTRDAWLHRVDLSRATGAELVLTADHDGRLVADVAAEWARRHGRPVHLTLAGPAGGTFVARGGEDAVGDRTATGEAEELELDAVEFCRILSGRAEGTGLLATEVPF